MFIDLEPAEQALRREAEAYFSTLMTPEDRRSIHQDEFGDAYKRICARLGRDGWLGRGWPVEYGGEGLGALAEQIIVSSAYRYRVPMPFATVFAVGLALQQFGTDHQKAAFLPSIRAGELHLAIGYTEPGAGTDLAALSTSARRDGDTYVVSGQKIFTSGVHSSDYIWLACRTNETLKRHRGISILIVDTSLAGISWTPIEAINRSRQLNALYLDEVRVPADMLVGAENGGWAVITHQLNAERFNAGPAGKIEAHLDAFKAWADKTLVDPTTRVADLPDVRRAVSEFSAITTVTRLLNWRSVADTGDSGGTSDNDVGPVHASVNKVYTSERLLEIGIKIAEIVHRYGDPADELTALLLREVEFAFKTELKLPVGGGVNEIQRELIAVLGLGLPRAPR